MTYESSLSPAQARRLRLGQILVDTLLIVALAAAPAGAYLISSAVQS